MNEFYDEFVFNEPTEYLYQLYPMKIVCYILNTRLMTPMKKPELPPEAVHWTVFNESEALAIIMRAQNYINDELIRE